MLHTDQSIHKACSQASKIIKTSNCNQHLTMESSSQSLKPIYFHLEQRFKKKNQVTHLNKQYKWQQWCTSIFQSGFNVTSFVKSSKRSGLYFCIFRKEDRNHIREQRLLCHRFVTWRFQPENVPSNLTEQYITSLKWKLDCQMKYLSAKYTLPFCKRCILQITFFQLLRESNLCSE